MAEERTLPGVVGFRALFSGLVALLGTRAELLGIEAQEWQERALGHLLVGVAALAATQIGLVALLLFVMVAAPLPWRALVLGALTLCFLLLALALWCWLRYRLSAAVSPFSLTLAEIRKDWQALSGKGAP